MSRETSSSHSPHPIAYGPDKSAEVLGVGRSKMYDLLRAKKVKSVLVGRRRLITHEELERIAREGA